MKGKLFYQFVTICLGLVAVCTVLSFYVHHSENRIQKQLAQKVLRFHVIANSDTDEDQNLKLKVRNAVGQVLEPRLAEAKDLQDTCRIVDDNMELIISTAKKTLREQGCTKNVRAFLTDVQFPDKQYGSYTFPQGEYKALELVIGSGKGKNWWCVLYPNLCFRGSMYEVVDKDAKEELKEILTVEEYAKIVNKGEFKVRLKFLEHFRKNS